MVVAVFRRKRGTKLRICRREERRMARQTIQSERIASELQTVKSYRIQKWGLSSNIVSLPPNGRFLRHRPERSGRCLNYEKL